MWQNRVLRIFWILVCIAFMLYIFTIKARWPPPTKDYGYLLYDYSFSLRSNR